MSTQAAAGDKRPNSAHSAPHDAPPAKRVHSTLDGWLLKRPRGPDAAAPAADLGVGAPIDVTMCEPRRRSTEGERHGFQLPRCPRTPSYR